MATHVLLPLAAIAAPTAKHLRHPRCGDGIALIHRRYLFGHEAIAAASGSMKHQHVGGKAAQNRTQRVGSCLLYTSDAADG